MKISREELLKLLNLKITIEYGDLKSHYTGVFKQLDSNTNTILLKTSSCSSGGYFYQWVDVGAAVSIEFSRSD